METNTFAQLKKDIAELLQIKDSDMQASHLQLLVDDMQVSLMDASRTEAGSVIYFCDFGAIPASSERADILQALLAANLFMIGSATPSFAVNHESNHAMLTGQFSLASMSATRLLRALTKYAEQAKEWRKTYFLGANRPPQAKQSRLLNLA